MEGWIVDRIRTRSAHRVGGCVAAAAVLLAVAVWQRDVIGGFVTGRHDVAFLRVLGIVGLAAAVFVAVTLVTVGGTSWRYVQDPASHPVAERLVSWGDPAGVAAAAARELRAPRFVGTDGWSITEQFLVQSTFFTFDILRLSDLQWAYRERRRDPRHGGPVLIPLPFIEGSYEAVFVCAGGTARTQGGRRTTDAMVEFALRRAPWAFQGESDEPQRLLPDRDALAAAVARRRQEWQRTQADAAG
jgi:hypothetical protein